MKQRIVTALAVGTVFVLLGFQAPLPQKTVPNQIKTKGDSYQQPTTQTPPVIYPATGNGDRRDSSDKPSKDDEQTVKITSVPEISTKAEKDFYDRALVISTILLVIVAGIQLWFLRGTVNATKDNAEAARLNAQAVINAERAWVLVKIEHVAEPTPDNSGVYVLPMVTNHGKTTGRVVKFALSRLTVASPKALPAEPKYEGERETDFILPPNEPVQPMSVVIPDQEFRAAQHGQAFLYIYGYIDYAIGMGTKDDGRRTRFCVLYYPEPATRPLPPGFYRAFDVPPAYTEST